VDRHIEPRALLEDDGERFGTFHGGDLGAPGAAVGKRVRGRVGRVDGGYGVPDTGEGVDAGAAGY
jgi:hypothetical protein